MTKICTKCKQERNIEEFNKDKYSKDGHFCWCKICTRADDKREYAVNKEKWNKLIKIKEIKFKLFLFDYFKTHPCVDCGETNPLVLEFDHLKDKKYGVAGLANHNPKIFQEEIKKCDVRCRNCHRRKTQVSLNSYRYKWLNDKDLKNV